MKKIQKFLLMGVALFLAAGFVGCTEDTTYSPGEKESGAQVYFPSTFSAEQLVNDDATSLTIPVKRVNVDEAVSITVASTYDNTMFSIPVSVNFAEGQDTANLVISFLKPLASGESYEIALLLNDPDNTTTYGASQLQFTVAVWPWEYVGVGSFRDDYLCNIFEGDFIEKQVNIHKHKTSEGIYMLEDMYGWSFFEEFFGAPREALSSQFSYTPSNIVIDCSDPANVTIDEQWIGLFEGINGYGNFLIMGTGGTLQDGIITFPVDGLEWVMDAYNPGNPQPANGSGMFRVVMPGYTAMDYSLGASFGGTEVAPNQETTTAVVNFAYGADVEGIKFVVVEGEYQDDPSALYSQIVAGGDSVYEVEDFVKGAGTVSILLNLAPQKFYTVAAMPVGADNKVVEKSAVALRFYFPGMQDPNIPAPEVAALLAKPSEMLTEEVAAMYPDFSNLVYLIQGNDLVSVKVYVGAAEVVDNLEIYGETVQSVIANYSKDITGWALADIADYGYAINLVDNLEPDTEYKMILYVQNKWGRESYIVSEGAFTAAIPYEGSLKLGEYQMTYEYDAETVFNSVFELKPLLDTETMKASETIFALQYLGSNQLDDEFLAFYDADSATLTLDGQMVGGDGTSYFDSLSYYMDSTQSSAMGWYTFDPLTSSESASEGKIIFGVENDAPASLQTYITLPVVQLADGQVIAFLGYYAPEATTIVPYVAEEVAPAMLSVKPINGDMSVRQFHNVAGAEKVNVVYDNTPSFLEVEVSKCAPVTREAYSVATLKARK